MNTLIETLVINFWSNPMLNLAIMMLLIVITVCAVMLIAKAVVWLVMRIIDDIERAIEGES